MQCLFSSHLFSSLRKCHYQDKTEGKIHLGAPVNVASQPSPHAKVFVMLGAATNSLQKGKPRWEGQMGCQLCCGAAAAPPPALVGPEAAFLLCFPLTACWCCCGPYSSCGGMDIRGPGLAPPYPCGDQQVPQRKDIQRGICHCSMVLSYYTHVHTDSHKYICRRVLQHIGMVSTLYRVNTGKGSLIL